MLLGLALAAIGLACGFAGCRPAPARPNILLITLDTTRADRLGCYGFDAAHTPNLDALAKRGVLFERAFAPAPLTLPSHTTMMTGLYPPEHGVRANGENGLETDVPTLAATLKQTGYDTAAFVAAFVLDKKFGLDAGFSIYDGLTGDVSPAEGAHAYRPGVEVVDAALAWLKLPRRQPFFCWVHLFDPHYPYLDHRELYGDEYLDRPYDAEIRYVDDQVGRLLKQLDETGLADRTIVIVVGDHGEALGEHHERTHSMQLYNSTLNVPWIAAAPHIAQPGVRIKTHVSLVDLAPTALDCVGVAAPQGLSGRSLRPALAGTEPDQTRIYAETDEPYRAGHWSPQRAIYEGNWKYILSPRDELYDLATDFGETSNVVAVEAETAGKLRETLLEWEATMIRRQGRDVPLSEADRLRMQSLGYASGGVAPEGAEKLVDVKDRMDLYHQLEDAETLVELGRFAAAVEPLQAILAEDEGYFRAHSYLGLCLMQLQRPADAIVHLRRSVELDPQAARVHSMLGAALLLDKQYAAAADVLETALRLNEASYQTQFNLGLALEELGRRDEALEHYAACVELAPDFAPARARIEKLTEP